MENDLPSKYFLTELNKKNQKKHAYITRNNPDMSKNANAYGRN